MSYRLRNGERLAVGIRRIAREQLEGALGEIAAATAGKEAAAVHETRKHIKKIRALLRLIRAKIGPEIFREENDRLREVARDFSGSRDARVQLQLLEKLREEAEPTGAAFAKTAAALQEEMVTHADSFGPARNAAETTLQWIGDRLEGWPLDDLEIENLCCALRFSYERGRKCSRSVRAEATAENFHSWRKRVKDIWYQSRVLQSLNPAVMCEIIQEARTLGQRLGDLHDLAFFRIRLEAETGGAEEERTVLLGLICTRERELKEVALDLGARFFAEKPGALERRLLRYAREWPRSRSA
jgi:CHAD domain-containing protein